MVEEPGMCGSFLGGNREIPRLTNRGKAVWSASERRGAVADVHGRGKSDEGVAIRIDPEPCADARKGGSEASVGERIGQQLSLAKSYPGRRRCCEGGRQHGRTRQRERLDSPAWSKNLACAEASWAGTGRSHV